MEITKTIQTDYFHVLRELAFNGFSYRTSKNLKFITVETEFCTVEFYIGGKIFCVVDKKNGIRKYTRKFLKEDLAC